MPAHVDCNDCLRAGGDGSFDELRVDAIGVREHVDEHGQGVCEQHRAGCGNQSEVGNNHLVVLSNSQCGHGHLQGCGAVGHGDPVTTSVTARESLCKLQSLCPRRTPPNSALQNVV